jgi:hypothetical protein
LYFCKPFREKIIQYRLNVTQRLASNKELSNILQQNNSDTVSVNSHSSELNNGTSYNSANSTINGQNGGNGSSNGGNTNINGSNVNMNDPNKNTSVLKQEHLLNCLAEMFYSIATMKKKKGTYQPKKFITRLRKDNG